VLICCSVWAGEKDQRDYAPFPQPDAGYVTDIADLLTGDQEEAIEQWLYRAEKEKGVEIVVSLLQSVRDYPRAPQTLEPFATAMFNRYGIGDKAKNNGILLLVFKKDRKLRIELGAGYAKSRDRDAKRIIDHVIVPRFKKNDYPGGVTEGVRTVLKEFAGMSVSDTAEKKDGSVAPSSPQEPKEPFTLSWPLVVVIVALLLLTRSLYARGKRGWGWVFAGAMVVAALGLFRGLGALADSATDSSSSDDDYGDSGGWSSGGFGGGFGGGFSSGGGASGSW